MPALTRCLAGNVMAIGAPSTFPSTLNWDATLFFISVPSKVRSFPAKQLSSRSPPSLKGPNLRKQRKNLIRMREKRRCGVYFHQRVEKVLQAEKTFAVRILSLKVFSRGSK